MDEKTSYRRVFVTVIIAVLTVALAVETVLCFLLFRALDSYRNGYGSRQEVSGADSPVGMLEEVSSLYEHNYIYDLDQEELMKAAVTAYLIATDDPYTYFYTPDELQSQQMRQQGSSKGIGISIYWYKEQINVIRVMKKSPAGKAGILAGDIITGVNGIDFTGMSFDEACDKLSDSTNEHKALEILRGNETITIELDMAEYETNTVDHYVTEYKGKKLGYLRITEFYGNTVREVKDAVEYFKEENVTGIVFDVRNNPGGSLDTIVKVLDYLLPEGDIVKLTFKDENQNEVFTSDAAYATDIPFAVLTNGDTASAAELFTSCLKDYERATIIGTKTYGKGCGQNTYTLSDSYAVKITTFLYSPPKSGNYDGVGITPDIVVELPEEYSDRHVYMVPESEDTQLKAALDLLSE